MDLQVRARGRMSRVPGAGWVWALGRMEVQIGLQTLFERFPQLTIAGKPTYNNNIGLHGLKHLPVALRAA